MNHDPAEINREMSTAIQTEAEKKLGRPLTTDEKYCIWNHGSFMGLELIYMAIYCARSPIEVEKYLANLPKHDSLPEDYTRPI